MKRLIITSMITLSGLFCYAQRDTTYDNYVKESQEWDRKRADTANYWEKDV